MTKTRYLFKKFGDIKGKFRTSIGMKTDRNWKYLTQVACEISAIVW